MLREWGIDIGFTYMPKFTYWESLTPAPLLKTRTYNTIPLCTPNQKWMYVQGE